MKKEKQKNIVRAKRVKFAQFAVAMSVAALLSVGTSAQVSHSQSPQGSSPYTSGIATMVPDSAYAVMFVKSIESSLEGVEGGINGILDKTEELMGEGTISLEKRKTIEKDVIEAFGFDPFLAKSYSRLGVSTTRPLALILAGLTISLKPEILLLIPVDNPARFEQALKDILERGAKNSGTGESAKIEVVDETGFKTVYHEGKKLFQFNFKGGYARLAPEKYTIDWLDSYDAERSLARGRDFVSSSKEAPQNPRYWYYISPRTTDVLRAFLESAGKMPGGTLREWISSRQGFFYSQGKKDSRLESFMSFPLPLNEDFRAIFKGNYKFDGVAKKMPPDPIIMAKGPLNLSAFYRTVGNLVKTIGGVRKYERFEREMQKEFGFDLDKELLANLDSGVFGALYLPTNLSEPVTSEKLLSMSRFMIMIPAGDKDRIKAPLAKLVEKIQKENNVRLNPVKKRDSTLYAYEVPSFAHYKAKSMQSEAKTNLSSLFIAEVAYFAETANWSGSFDEIGYNTGGETVYSYYLSCNEVIRSSKTNYKGCPEKVRKWLSGVDRKTGFRAAAVGNIDSDKTLDIWFIDENRNLQNVQNDLDDKPKGEVPLMEVVFGVSGANMVITNDMKLLKKLDKDADSGESAYDLAVSVNERETMDDPHKFLCIYQLSKWAKVVSNIEEEEAKDTPFESNIFNKVLGTENNFILSMWVQEDALMSRSSWGGTNVPALGIIAALAIPNFIEYQARARQSEAKTNLASIATAQIAFFGEMNKWSNKFDEIGWRPEGKTKYSYYLTCDEVIPSTETGYAECPAELKEWLETPCNENDGEYGCFKAGAVGNIDSDDTLDIWVIDQNRIPRNIINDAKE